MAEQADRRRCGNHVVSVGIGAGRHRERSDGETTFGAEAERGATGDQQHRARARLQQLRDKPNSAHQMLEIVQHQQQPPPAEVLEHSFPRTVSTRLAELQGASDGRRQQTMVAERCEVDEDHSAAVCVG